jgi:WS/DGAT/MGAT family acyltransferase
VDERRLSDFEAVMWTLEADPHLTTGFANVTFLDRAVDEDRFRERMLDAIEAVPRLRRRIEGGWGLTPPTWVDDEVDLERHVRRVELDPPGDERQLLELATSIASAPFVRDRALWEFVVVDGLADGRGAMVQKIHHTITDGQGGVRMSAQFIDLERDPPPRPRPERVEEPVAATAPPSTVEGLLGPVSGLVQGPIALARQAAAGATDVVTHPTRLGTLPVDAVATARSVARQLGVTGGCLSPLWGDRTLGRRLELLRVPVADLKAAAATEEASINDAFVAAAAGGAGAFHRERGVEVDELRMAMPVSTRSDKGAAGNAFAPTRLRVPVTSDPRARLREVRDRIGALRQERAVGLAGTLSSLGNLLPPPVLVRLVRQQTAAVDFTTSNVRGAPFPLYIAGARVLANHPIGPLGGTAWNLTTLSVDGSLDMGLHVDTGAVDDPDLLRRCVEDAFAELLDLT